MDVQCPHCESAYTIDSELIPSSGAIIACPACSKDILIEASAVSEADSSRPIVGDTNQDGNEQLPAHEEKETLSEKAPVSEHVPHIFIDNSTKSGPTLEGADADTFIGTKPSIELPTTFTGEAEQSSSPLEPKNNSNDNSEDDDEHFEVDIELQNPNALRTNASQNKNGNTFVEASDTKGLELGTGLSSEVIALAPPQNLKGLKIESHLDSSDARSSVLLPPKHTGQLPIVALPSLDDLPPSQDSSKQNVSVDDRVEQPNRPQPPLHTEALPVVDLASPNDALIPSEDSVSLFEDAPLQEENQSSQPIVALPSIALPSIGSVEGQNNNAPLPQVEVPGLSAPAIQLEAAPPSIELTNIEIPNISLPSLEASVELPEADVALALPNIEQPSLEVPNVELPPADVAPALPNIELPSLALPDFEPTDFESPPTNIPKVETPIVALPNAALPNLDLPDLQLPSSNNAEERPKIEPQNRQGFDGNNTNDPAPNAQFSPSHAMTTPPHSIDAPAPELVIPQKEVEALPDRGFRPQSTASIAKEAIKRSSSARILVFALPLALLVCMGGALVHTFTPYGWFGVDFFTSKSESPPLASKADIESNASKSNASGAGVQKAEDALPKKSEHGKVLTSLELFSQGDYTALRSLFESEKKEDKIAAALILSAWHHDDSAELYLNSLNRDSLDAVQKSLIQSSIEISKTEFSKAQNRLTKLSKKKNTNKALSTDVLVLLKAISELEQKQYKQARKTLSTFTPQVSKASFVHELDALIHIEESKTAHKPVNGDENDSLNRKQLLKSPKIALALAQEELKKHSLTRETQTELLEHLNAVKEVMSPRDRQAGYNVLAEHALNEGAYTQSHGWRVMKASVGALKVDNLTLWNAYNNHDRDTLSKLIPKLEVINADTNSKGTNPESTNPESTNPESTNQGFERDYQNELERIGKLLAIDSEDRIPQGKEALKKAKNEDAEFESMMHLAWSYLFAGQSDKAQSYFVQSTQLKPDAWMAQREVILYWFQRGMLSRVAKQLEILKGVVRDEKGALEMRTFLGALAARQENYSKAKKIVKDLAQVEYFDARNHQTRAKVFIAERNFDAAKSEVDKALRLDASNRDSIALAAEILGQQKNIDEAIPLLKELVEKSDSTIDDKVNLAYWLYKSGDLEKGASLAVEAKEKAPANPRRLFVEAVALAQSDPSSAFSLLNRARENAPEDLEIAFEMGRILAENNIKRSQGIHALEKVMSSPEASARAAFYLGKLNRSSRGYTKAKKWFKRCTELDPKEAKCWVELGDVELKRNRATSALKYYSRAEDLDPENVELVCHRGVMLVKRLGDRRKYLKEGQKYLERCVQMNSEDSKAYATLGDVYKDQKKNQAALAAYEGYFRFKAEANESSPVCDQVKDLGQDCQALMIRARSEASNNAAKSDHNAAADTENKKSAKTLEEKKSES